MRRKTLAQTVASSLMLLAGSVGSGHAATADRPTVVELFTSEGCSSCPPADAYLRDLARTRADVLPLAFHVTYWNYLGWRDPFSLDAATARQRAYGTVLSTPVYTPQMVVDGRGDVIGSDRTGAEAALREASRNAAPAVPVKVRRDGDRVLVEIGGAKGSGTVFLVGYDPQHTTPVNRGENGGRTLVEANIVRSFAPVAEWKGDALHFFRPIPTGEMLAVIVQGADGHILGAAREVSDAG